MVWLRAMVKRTFYLILDNIRSSENVGAIFRTADAIGINKIYLTGITPTPIDRFGRKQNKISKVALGAEETVPWEHSDDILSLIHTLKKENVQIVALEQDQRSKDYKSFVPESDVVIIVGAEVDGISQDILNVSDIILEIPMYGKKESLNVSVSVGIVLYRLLD